MTSVVETYPERILTELVEWCQANVTAAARPVAAVGFAYGCGLNEHQIARVRLVDKGEPITVDYPLARRAAEICTAVRETLICDEPNWLAAACGQLAKERSRPGRFLFSQRPFGVPPAPGEIRDRYVSPASKPPATS